MYAVVGANGQTGSGTVRALVAQGKKVRAIVRDHAAGAALPAGATLAVVPRFSDAAALRAALDGVRYVYCGLGRAMDLVELEQHVVDAARAAGVDQYVKCSGVQVSLDGPSQIQRIHAQLEDYVRANVPWTIVAPSFFFQNFLGLAGAVKAGVLPLPTGTARAGYVDAEDICRSVVAVLGETRHLGQRYRITGPESLSHGEIAERMTAILGRTVQFVDVPEAAFAASCEQAGLPDWFARLLADVYAHFYGSGAADLVSDDVRALTGSAPRGFDAWLREHAAAFV